MDGVSASRTVKTLQGVEADEKEKMVKGMIWTPTYQGPVGDVPTPRLESTPAADFATRAAKR
eukprot:2126184-Heterocapsa_arctica.AAC.1